MERIVQHIKHVNTPQSLEMYQLTFRSSCQERIALIAKTLKSECGSFNIADHRKFASVSIYKYNFKTTDKRIGDICKKILNIVEYAFGDMAYLTSHKHNVSRTLEDYTRG